MGDVTVLLERAHQGDAQASNELFASVYGELNRLARQKLARAAAFTDLMPWASCTRPIFCSFVRGNPRAQIGACSTPMPRVSCAA